jgi:hypothetical protein
MMENEAWGFVRVGREIDYVAMYLGHDVREVRYIAEVDSIVAPSDAGLERPASEYADDAKLADDKRVIKFKPGTLYKLADPIPFKSEYPQALRYTTLEKFKQAKSTDDLFE